jgi:hypothetical protein
MRTLTLGLACAFLFFAAGAVTGQAPAGMAGAPSDRVAEMKPNSVPLSAPEPDPAERSAKSIECAQKADAQELQGKIRKRFLHKCKRNP